MLNNAQKEDNRLLNKIRKDHSSPSQMLYFFIWGLVFTFSFYLENERVGAILFLIVTLLYGVRFFYLILFKKTHARSRLLLIASLSILVSLAIFYIHQTYFFNPVTFKKSAFLYESWNNYNNPVSMKITGGSTQAKKVTDPFQVKMIMNDIEKTSPIQVSIPKNPGPTFEIDFYTGNTVFQHVLIYPNYQVAQYVTEIKTNNGSAKKIESVYLPPDLLRYVNNQLGVSH
ncbi:hypothetical protein PU629_09225 [Pullulanibacillus sp. KACC 23026]|uniref:hypothetical protein n=1 Tax=Pullulanibacillus sp. KACC 23026 TaxID=3028315 RepID=UPI0023B15EEF|nr:hypothetical protein [Pullulanibacillus sp. KACC 23026]WEG14517.1 hypothetical protein PU629_09225 [Pullulanibacillus sp. KACC 23026]